MSIFLLCADVLMTNTSNGIAMITQLITMKLLPGCLLSVVVSVILLKNVLILPGMLLLVVIMLKILAMT